MFFVSTTANFPDQMLASYASSRSFGLFFAFYVLLACFIFLNSSPLLCHCSMAWRLTALRAQVLGLDQE